MTPELYDNHNWETVSSDARLQSERDFEMFREFVGWQEVSPYQGEIARNQPGQAATRQKLLTWIVDRQSTRSDLGLPTDWKGGTTTW